jgi:ubiquitin carboxyl-terminal hydrolase 34
MTPAFRYAILLADDGKEQAMVPHKTRDGMEVMIDDNIIHQFQKLFAYLDYSDRPDYNPFRFCFAFKDYTGQPVNVAIQQDAQEFLNMIFDKLETGLGQWK